LKAVLLGSSNVGKSALAMRWIQGSFNADSSSTIGACYMAKTIDYYNRKVKIELWDTAGAERYHSLAPMYYRGAALAICVYDITCQLSFERLHGWVKELLRPTTPVVNCGVGAVIAVVGNKRDLEEKREVSQEALEDFVKNYEGKVEVWGEISAKMGEGVDDLFLALVNAYLAYHDTRGPDPQD